MPSRRYMQDRASRRNSMMRDGRNPYGSKGGYVTSRRGMDRAMDMNYDMARSGRNRGYDRTMDMEYDYTKYNGEYDSRYGRERRNQDGHYPYERYGEHNRPMDFEMYGYGIGGFRPMDYARNNRGRDYGIYDYSSDDMEKEWKEDLHEWTEKLKKHDRFNVPKDQLIHKARQMGVPFDSYSEDEFITVYYMVMSDYPQIANEPHSYLALAKDWLHDKDSKLQGADKLCAYYYEVVEGGEKD